ncbi:hypothetical protein DPMN_164886 [Dreissena polymorpha]|uniref:Uncharacterized protein n=1 Tax=Dreissena polymorpha TaxID=45954 RepID=A0A9D4EV18_DREPO|nr:hypothetical protein DPMN_164886 [Dreissena polymorpha]
MASNSTQKEDITKQKASELTEVSEISESESEESEEKCKENDNKRKYISSVSEQYISINSTKEEGKQQSQKKPKHKKSKMQEAANNESKDNISFNDSSK